MVKIFYNCTTSANKLIAMMPSWIPTPKGQLQEGIVSETYFFSRKLLLLCKFFISKSTIAVTGSI